MSAKRSASTRDGSGHIEIINVRAMLMGLGVFVMLVLVAVFWRMAAQHRTKKVLQEFEFKINEPIVEKFELRDPMRDILRERRDDLDAVEVDERPDFVMSVAPSDVAVFEQVVQVRQLEIETPEIEVESEPIDLDAAEEIVEVSETIAWAVNPIAAITEDAGDIFQYEKPNPASKPQRYFANMAPQPSRSLTMLPKTFGNQEAPTIGPLGPVSINFFGSGDFFRTMKRQGDMRARSSVDAALHWLAVHQEATGLWDPGKYEGQEGNRVGITGFSILAFLSGGHTARKGAYRRNVLRAVEALMKEQRGDGMLSLNLYNHSIATIALCEAYGRARDERIGSAARKAVYYLERAQNRDGGWRYSANSGTSDMSVSGWCVQALKTAKLANIKVDNSVYARSLLYVDSLTDKGGGKGSSGGVGYTFAADQNYGAGSPNLTPAGMVVRQFIGTGVQSEVLVNAAKLVRRSVPDWRSKNFYRWYYATYAMHNMGGEHRIWWNRRIRDVLLGNQSRDGDNAGSWDPVGDAHANAGGRVYTTALGALCLEVYYRYSDALTSFGVAPDIDDLFLQ
jgi:hypothetical protein